MSENAIEEALSRDVAPFINFLDSIRDLGIQNEIHLPQICVVGDQSSGKSSVLASMSGLWLPRGSGLTTRCPVQVRMHKNTGIGGWQARAGLAGSKKREQPVPTPEALSEVVSELMADATANSAHGLSAQTVAVDIESPHLPNLTLVDLPGIIRTRVAGQQKSVLEDVNTLIDNYMHRETTLIFAVVPSNQDIATAEVLERAAAADPAGSRTLAVLTKPDLIGPGNEQEAIEVVMNKRKPLRLGYVMVRNSPSNEAAESISSEEDWFTSHPQFSSLDRSFWGLKTLTSKLTALLAVHIHKFLPYVKYQLQVGLASVDSKLSALGGQATNLLSREDKKKKLTKLLAQVVSLMRESCRGDYRSAIFMTDSDLRMRQVVDTRFRALHANLEGNGPCFGTQDFVISLRMTMEGLRGRELPGLFSSQLFYGFMAEQVEIWRPKVENCKIMLQGSLENFFSQLCRKTCSEFPHLVTQVIQIFSKVLEQLEDTISIQLEQVFERELDPFTASDDLKEAMEKTRFERFDLALSRAMQVLPKDSSKEMWPKLLARNLGSWYLNFHGADVKNRASDMATVLEAYWQVSSKRVTDNCCMILESNLLTKLVDWLEMKLLEFAQQSSLTSLDALFYTDPVLVKQRQDSEAQRLKYVTALQALEKLAPGLVSDANSPGKQTPLAPLPSFTKSSPLSQLHASSADGTRRRTPEQKANSAGNGSVAIFDLEDSQTSDGLFQWMGTKGYSSEYQNPMSSGLCRVTSSGMLQGYEEMILNRDNQTLCKVKCEAEGSFICIDLGRRRQLQPTAIRFRGGQMEWGILGRDGNNQSSTLVTSPQDCQHNSLESVFNIHAQGKSYRCFQIYSISKFLPLEIFSIELFGSLFAVT